MGKIKQEVNVKRKATHKDDSKAKYKIASSNKVVQTTKNGNVNTKYAYTKKITINGKTRYYYS